MDNRHCCSARESSQENFSRRKLAHSMSRQFLILWIRQTLRATTMSGEVERLSSLRVARQQMEKRKCRLRVAKGRSTGCGVERRAVHYRNAGGRAGSKHLFRQRETLFPVPEPILEVDFAGVPNPDTRELTPGPIDFDHDLRDGS